MPKEDTQFKEGNPGRPKGSYGGRRKCLLVLDKMLAKKKNLKRLEQAFQRRFDKNPLLFWAHYAVPVLPKQIELETGTIKVMLKFVEAKEKDGRSGRGTKGSKRS